MTLPNKSLVQRQGAVRPIALFGILTALLCGVGIAQAKDQPTDTRKVFVTVTNKSDLILSLTLNRVWTEPLVPAIASLSNTVPLRKIPVRPLSMIQISKSPSGTNWIQVTAAPTPLPPSLPKVPPPSLPSPAPSTKMTELLACEMVKPQQQTILQIPKGDYMVEATAAPQPPGSRPIRIMRPYTFRSTEFISTNEDWSFELENGSKPAVLPETTQTIRQIPVSPTWRREVQPARQDKQQNSRGVSQTPERRARLAPGEQPVIEPLRKIPARDLRPPPTR